MPWINQVGSLTVPSGSVSSDILSQSVFGPYDVLAFFVSGSITGPMAVEVSNDAVTNKWYTLITAISSSQVIVMESFPYDAIRLNGSTPQSSNLVVYVTGQVMGMVGGSAIRI